MSVRALKASVKKTAKKSAIAGLSNFLGLDGGTVATPATVAKTRAQPFYTNPVFLIGAATVAAFLILRK